ncbi:hypothetical protein [Erwinia sp. E_sp_B04_7]|uniref:hypothetical protein n=1 Tax=unclassified Erwinia TaxID=2622719 RepID=UPI0030D453BB
MRRILKIASGLIFGLIVVMSLCVLALYIDIRLGYKADVKACPNVKPSEAIAAVIRDVIRPTNQVFAKYHLSANDVSVNLNEVQIGPSAILVPFRISKAPQREFFGMPRCSVLSNIEYASD